MVLCMMSFEYTVKVYADAVELGLRDLESIPENYRIEVWRGTR